MQQVKLFKGVESDLSTLENDINAWIADARVKVLEIEANIAPQTPGAAAGGGGGGGRAFAPSDVVVALLYERDSG
jgi:hypothetical protein